MKPLSPLLRRKPLLLAALLFCLALSCPAAQTRTNAPTGAAPAPTNAPPAQLEIPKSVFVIPTTPKEGKDPFFPLSTRLYAPVAVKTNKQPTAAAAVTIDLKLKGISGTADHRLAIINNRTFEAGEEGEVTSQLRAVRITCREIGDDFVRVLVNGQERTLRLRPGS